MKASTIFPAFFYSKHGIKRKKPVLEIIRGRRNTRSVNQPHSQGFSTEVSGKPDKECDYKSLYETPEISKVQPMYTYHNDRAVSFLGVLKRLELTKCCLRNKARQ